MRRSARSRRPGLPRFFTPVSRTHTHTGQQCQSFSVTKQERSSRTVCAGEAAGYAFPPGDLHSLGRSRTVKGARFSGYVVFFHTLLSTCSALLTHNRHSGVWACALRHAAATCPALAAAGAPGVPIAPVCLLGSGLRACVPFWRPQLPAHQLSTDVKDHQTPGLSGFEQFNFLLCRLDIPAAWPAIKATNSCVWRADPRMSASPGARSHWLYIKLIMMFALSPCCTVLPFSLGAELPEPMQTTHVPGAVSAYCLLDRNCLGLAHQAQ